MKKFILPLLLFLVVSCGKKNSAIPVLDVNGSFPKKDLVLQEISTVEYIPLETTDEFLLDSYAPIHHIDDEVIVTSNKSHIFFFDRKTGKGLYSFSRQGRGPGEYTQVGLVVVDKQRGELFVTQSVSYSNNRPVYVYDLQGRHLRTLDFEPSKGPGNYLHIYDDEYLFSYSSYNENNVNPAPYRLISRVEAVSTDLPVEFTGRDNMNIITRTESSMTIRTGGGTNILKTAEGYIFSEPGIDTIYSWNRSKAELTPLIACTPSFASMNYPIAAYVNGQNDDYLFLSTTERKYDTETNQGFAGKRLVFDKKEQRFYEGGVVNSDYADRNSFGFSNSVSLPVGTFTNRLDAWRLAEQYEQGKLKGELAEVASRLKEDDNPVLMVVTFK